MRERRRNDASGRRGRLAAHCKTKGRVVGQTNIEPGDSARDDHRPVLQEMVEDVHKRHFDVVVSLTTS